MPDPFKPVNPGDPIEPSAVAWNAMLLAGKEAKARQLNQGAAAQTTTLQSTIIRIKNESGVILGRNAVVGLDGSLFTPSDSEDSFLRAVTFKGVKPLDSHHKRRYAIMVEPCLGDRFSRAWIAGVCQVKVNIVDEAHEYAIIDNNRTDRLKSSFHGHARILWKESDDAGYGYGGYGAEGVMWTIVMLGVTGSCVAIGKAIGDIPPRVGDEYGGGIVGIYRSNAGHEDGPIELIDVLNASQDTEAYGYGAGITDGKYCAIAWDADDVAWVSPLEC